MTFDDCMAATWALRRQHHLAGRRLECKKAKPKEVFGDFEGNEGALITKKVFIGGLGEDVTEDDLRKTFEAFGVVTEVVVVSDKQSAVGRCFGFVTFQSAHYVENIMRNYYDVRIKGKWVGEGDAGGVQESGGERTFCERRQEQPAETGEQEHSSEKRGRES